MNPCAQRRPQTASRGTRLRAVVAGVSIVGLEAAAVAPTALARRAPKRKTIAAFCANAKGSNDWEADGVINEKWVADSYRSMRTVVFSAPKPIRSATLRVLVTQLINRRDGFDDAGAPTSAELRDAMQELESDAVITSSASVIADLVKLRTYLLKTCKVDELPYDARASVPVHQTKNTPTAPVAP